MPATSLAWDSAVRNWTISAPARKRPYTHISYDIATYDLSPERYAIGDRPPAAESETLIMRNRSTARAV